MNEDQRNSRLVQPSAAGKIGFQALDGPADARRHRPSPPPATGKLRMHDPGGQAGMAWSAERDCARASKLL
jgi:hypothetical protein